MQGGCEPSTLAGRTRHSSAWISSCTSRASRRWRESKRMQWSLPTRRGHVRYRGLPGLLAVRLGDVGRVGWCAPCELLGLTGLTWREEQQLQFLVVRVVSQHTPRQRSSLF